MISTYFCFPYFWGKQVRRKSKLTLSRIHRATVNLVGQGRLTTTLTISISVIRGARKMIIIFLFPTFSGQRSSMKSKFSSVTCIVDSVLEMISIVVKRPWSTRSTVHVTKIIWISIIIIIMNSLYWQTWQMHGQNKKNIYTILEAFNHKKYSILLSPAVGFGLGLGFDIPWGSRSFKYEIEISAFARQSIFDLSDLASILVLYVHRTA